jgi:hypothetical protein
MLVDGRKATYAADRVLEFKERLDGFALLRAGALTEGAITNWRFDSSLLLRLTFHAPNLTVEHGSQRQQVVVSWYSPYPPIIRPHLHCPTWTGAATRFTKLVGPPRVGAAATSTMPAVTSTGTRRS